MASVTPMMRQYLQIKQEQGDAILFFRLGDFYEMFFDDALTASRELELTLTGKDCGLEERAPMCGVPYHAVDGYVQKLIDRGYKVAICEQMTDPALAKGLVERAVIRVVTPGTALSVRDEKQNSFIAAVCAQGKRAGISWCDVTTGEFFARQLTADELRAALQSVSPREIIVNDKAAVQPYTDTPCDAVPGAYFAATGAKERLLSHFQAGALTALGLEGAPQATQAAGALMRYLLETQKNGLSHITRVRVLAREETMPLDAGTRRNLEVTEGLRGRDKRGSLLWLLDKTCTAMGGRLLRAWLERPLTSKGKIEARLDCVEALKNDAFRAESLRERLRAVYDLERLLSRVTYKTLTPRDCLALARSLAQIPDIQALIAALGCPALDEAARGLSPQAALKDLLSRAISEDAPIQAADGGVIRQGYSEQLDGYRAAATDGKGWIMELERREREETGIKNLKIQYNRVFGYYIEVTKSNYQLVPYRYQRRQTLAACERFTTDELREIEGKVTGAQEQAQKLEAVLFDGVRDAIAEQIAPLQDTAEALKTLDALLSLARAATEYGYCRPSINETGELTILDGRHPVVERTLEDGAFVPNDTRMDAESRRMQIITGPNMAGKSTYMRQVALIALMAHMGSFVPAREADIPLMDCVYTRVGASDDLASGQSTFMVEMSEMAYILKNATAKSLVILDEIGRGTSTFDGLSIAWAAAEYLLDQTVSGAKTLFATHYHELSELEGKLPGVENYCVAVKEHGEDVIFLRKITRGGADKSFGVYVARLAGVPKKVVARAREIQARLEISNINQNTIGKNILKDGSERKGEQVGLFQYAQTELVDEIAKLDVLAMSPMDALNELFLLREKARKL